MGCAIQLRARLHFVVATTARSTHSAAWVPTFRQSEMTVRDRVNVLQCHLVRSNADVPDGSYLRAATVASEVTTVTTLTTTEEEVLKTLRELDASELM